MTLAATEAQLFTKQRVGIGVSAFSGLLSPITKAFFMTMAQFANAKGLITYIISNLTTDLVVADAPCTLYAVWLKKQATATDSFFKIFDDASDDSTAGDAVLCMPLMLTGEEQFWCCPAGHPLAAGLVPGAYTAFIGANNVTPTTTGDGPNGVIVYGAA